MYAPDSKLETERLSGSVERIHFHSQDNGFCVLRLKVRGRRDPVSVVGFSPTLTVGEYLECVGHWETNTTYGLQFRTDSLQSVPPTTLSGLRKYLGSGVVLGVGPQIAETLIEAFGDKLIEVIEEQPEKLRDLPGIGKKRQKNIVNGWNRQKSVRDIMVFLQSHGVGTARAVRIHKRYGQEAIAKVTENPYRLVLDIRGVGFSTADTLAQKLGISKDSPLRAQAGVRHVLQEISNEGHCATPTGMLMERANVLLSIPTSIIETAIQHELQQGQLVQETLEGQTMLMLRYLYRAETGVAENLHRLLQGETHWADVDLKERLRWARRRTKLDLSPSQKKAVEIALQNKVAVITGGPGVGKTTLVNTILQIILTEKATVLLCAPTGRAAKRLAESTQLEAKTIHRTLGVEPGLTRFQHHEDNPLKADLVVVDEVSMVDICLMHSLVRAIPSDAGLLLVGDVDQLPSVGPGAVLADLITSNHIPTVPLTEIFRQAQSSHIVRNAHRINAGELPENKPSTELNDFYCIAANSSEHIQQILLTVVLERIPKRFQLHPVRDIQVLTPMNRGGLGTQSLNSILQQRLNGDAEPRVERFGWTYAPNDKVIQMVNNYDKEVFNGDIGRISRVDTKEGELHVDYEGRSVRYIFGELDELSLAYATTVHKAQGAEYPAVVIPLANQHYNLLQRNLLYTAVTRGKQLVVLIAQPQALATAVNNLQAHQRRTGLREFLVRICEADPSPSRN